MLTPSAAPRASCRAAHAGATARRGSSSSSGEPRLIESAAAGLPACRPRLPNRHTAAGAAATSPARCCWNPRMCRPLAGAVASLNVRHAPCGRDRRLAMCAGAIRSMPREGGPMIASKKADLAGPGIGTYEDVERSLPTDYRPLIGPKETQHAIHAVKRYIEDG